ncbi:VOC family protein [Natrinema soli]|uniref:VOC family protein n=1 Tax=Natrinema soli TaxID=1930624 RepID=A0ABD5SKM9_9EURY|nr:VOC family protein [Natrinema soli]
MTDIHRIEHARIGVEDLEAAVSFYTDGLGLVEFEQKDGVVYLGCGRDDNYDVGLIEGETGIEHFAVRATDASVVEEYEQRLEGADVSTERTDGNEPGQEAGVRFSLPSGVAMEVVAVSDDKYQHFEEPKVSRGGQAPADVNHIQFLTPDVVADMEFLRDSVGLKISEIAGSPDDPEIAFARCKTFHHDVALKSSQALGETDNTSLHHLAFGFDSADHLVNFIDSAVNAGCEFERGIGRHHGGNNIYAYIWTPGGNRLELNTQMATLTREEPEISEDYESATVAWGPDAPESFTKGSGLLHKK